MHTSKQVTRLVFGLALGGIIALPAFAASAESKNIDQLKQQVAQLSKQVSNLETQVHHQNKKISKIKVHKGSIASTDNTLTPVPAAEETAGEDNSNEATSLTYLPLDFGVPGKSFVSSGPYIGIPISYSGGHLIINTPSVNQDVTLLKLRKNVANHLQALGIQPSPGSTHLLLSGIVEGQGTLQKLPGSSSSSNLDITSAGIDAYVLGPGPWLSALIALNYDNSPPASSNINFNNNSRVLNSHVFVNQAFITVGNFNRTPFYGTFGQLYVPFGTYSTSFVTASMTQSLARTKARALVLGYQPQQEDAFYTAGYIFKGDTYTGSSSRVSNGGLNLGYRFVQNAISADFGGGVIANLADSVGMQDVGNSTANFNGFGGTNGVNSEQLVHRVPAYNARGIVSIGSHVNVLAEYITAAKQFSMADLTMNSHGARPQALHTEATYSFMSFSHPSSVAVGYGMTKDALALGLPEHRLLAVFNTSIWRDTLQSLEFRRDYFYAASSTASGSTLPASPSTGRAGNTVTAQFDVYF